MRDARPVLFYLFISIFAATAVVTLLGITGVLQVPDKYLNVLFTALLVELVGTVIGLFKATDWLGRAHTADGLTAIQGGWWQLVRGEDLNALSFVQISWSEERRQLSLNAQAFTTNGLRNAEWWSIAAAYNPNTTELHYFWRGDHASEDDDFSGVGVIRFEVTTGDEPAVRATGWFTQGNIEQVLVTARRKVEMRRPSPDELGTMTSDDGSAKTRLAASVHSAWQPVSAALGIARTEM